MIDPEGATPPPPAPTPAPPAMPAPRFVPFDDERWADAIRAFNARIATVAPQFRVRDAANPATPPAGRIDSRVYLAVEGETVRGSVTLHRQAFVAGGQPVDAANMQLPITEALVDRRFASLGMWLVKQMLKLQPLVYGVGMGGMEQPLPKLLAAMGWRVALVPFVFRVHRPARFLTRMPALQRTPARRLAARAAAWSGAGWAAGKLAAAWDARRSLIRRGLRAEPAEGWGPWADDVWATVAPALSFAATRDRAGLEAMYPVGGVDDRYHRYRLVDGARTVGWLVLLDTPMRGSAHFGDLRVGTILDLLAEPGRELDAAVAARRVMARRGVDLSIANQQHAGWLAVLRTAGWRDAPSNYVLALSPKLAKAVEAAGGADAACITRGDGDGRIHL